MSVAIVHLSDIHFRAKNNPVLEKHDQIVSAVSSIDPTVSLFLIVVSGDIAFSGNSDEYAVARSFFDDLEKKLGEHQPDVSVRFFCVPGNHDCVLPESERTLRDLLIHGLSPTLGDATLDPAVLDRVLEVQTPI